MQAPNPQHDHYRCPECDHSLLRGDPPPALRPGIYRDGYAGPWFACPTHGIVQARYYDHRHGDGESFADLDDVAWNEREQAVDLLIEVSAGPPSAGLRSRIAEFLRPIVEERDEHARESHCNTDKPAGHVDSDGFCSTCGRYWQQIEGVWFRGARRE